MKKQLINPFENDTVSEPRHIDKAVVTGLNDKPLEAIIRQFESLRAGQRPAKKKLSHAQFVVSSQAGYGKSHLIGRLFHKLSGSATLVYLRPFEDASTCWKSVLLKMVQELDFPDNTELEYCNDNEPTQLEAFAHGILVHLIADAVKNGDVRTKNKQAMIDYLNGATVETFRSSENKWLRDNYKMVISQCSRQLQRNGVRLYASALSWLGVLFTYTYFPAEYELRETCRDWLQGGTINPEEAEQIGIRSRDIPNAEMGSGESNELCKHRITDFCRLAGFFRPFVFCFDQTENYGNDIVLAKVFGLVIQVLTDETYNQMTVVTTKQDSWSKSIEPWWEEAHKNRLSPPLELEGLNQKQGAELIEHRFRGLDTDEKHRFIDAQWLKELFQGGSELGIRDFIQRCSNRWLVIEGGTIKPRDISRCYKKAVEQIRTQPKRFVFDPNTLYWLVSEVADGLPDLTFEKYKSQKGYFTLLWKLSDTRRILFGFESEANWKRWQAIDREANIHYRTDNNVKAVLFRTPELRKIPGPKWKIASAINAAQKEYLHIIQLEKPQMAELYAARDLYVDAGEGNIPFQRHEVLSFIRQQLGPFWDRVQRSLASEDAAGGTKPPDKITKELIEEIRRIVREEKFMSADELINRLSVSISPEALHEARAHIPQIRVHVGPNTTMIQWQSDK
ncbi:hypothetical protein QUF80_22670 [Desulfococcaceae bacterium HSG8]|nr:hypothetical protein [Desulfococcaceae bacterium HSG8]